MGAQFSIFAASVALWYAQTHTSWPVWFTELAQLSLLYVCLSTLHRVAVVDGPQRSLKRLLGTLLAGAKHVPGVQGALQGELAKEVAKIEMKMHGDGDPDAFTTLPPKGMSKGAVLALAERLQEADDRSGKSWGGIYHEPNHASELSDLQAEMWARFNNTNALYPTIFKAVRKGAV